MPEQCDLSIVSHSPLETMIESLNDSHLSVGHIGDAREISLQLISLRLADVLVRPRKDMHYYVL